MAFLLIIFQVSAFGFNSLCNSLKGTSAELVTK